MVVPGVVDRLTAAGLVLGKADGDSQPPQHLDQADTDIPDQYKEAITYLTVSRVSRIVALRIEKALDPPGGATFVSMRNKSAGFSDIADMWEQMYREEIGGVTIKPATARRDYDSTFRHGADYMFHSDRR